jgi:hypothetical protein
MMSLQIGMDTKWSVTYNTSYFSGWSAKDDRPAAFHPAGVTTSSYSLTRANPSPTEGGRSNSKAYISVSQACGFIVEPVLSMSCPSQRGQNSSQGTEADSASDESILS